MASAQQNRSPMLVLGGRAPAMRWGQGSLQEIDHVPFVRPLVKLAATAGSTAEIPGLIDEAWDVDAAPALRARVPRLPARRRVHRGRGGAAARGAPAAPRPDADAAAVERAAALLRDAERPVIMAGTNLYWGRGEHALRELAEAAGVPVFLNGLARGCLPADHDLLLARAQRGAQGRRRGARDRRADGLPARLRRRVRRGDRDRASTAPSPSATTRGRSRPSVRRRRRDAGRAGRRRRRATPSGVGRAAARRRGREARGRGRAARRRPRAAAPDAPVPRARARCSTATRS